MTIKGRSKIGVKERIDNRVVITIEFIIGALIGDILEKTLR
jgi:hypothetical protein